jgi:hypothetical protein
MRAYMRLVDTHQQLETQRHFFQTMEETNLVLRRFAYGAYALHRKTGKDQLYRTRSKHEYIRTVAGVNDWARYDR